MDPHHELLTGLLAVACAIGARRMLKGQKSGGWGVLIGTVGLGLIVALAGAVAQANAFGARVVSRANAHRIIIFEDKERRRAMADEGFFVEYRVDWNDLDPNFHLRAAVLVDYAVNTQFAWLEHLGFKQAMFAEQGYEPIVLRMEARYHHEAGYNEVVRDTPVVTASSPDCSRWKIKHSYVKNGGEKVGWIVLEGTWLNWKTRQAVAPSEEIIVALNKLPRSSDFEQLKSFVKGKGAPT